MSDNEKVPIYGFTEKEMWPRLSCHSCHKTLGFRNYPEDDTILCVDCFTEWDGEKGPGSYEISLDVKKKV